MKTGGRRDFTSINLLHRSVKCYIRTLLPPRKTSKTTMLNFEDIKAIGLEFGYQVYNGDLFTHAQRRYIYESPLEFPDKTAVYITKTAYLKTFKAPDALKWNGKTAGILLKGEITLLPDNCTIECLRGTFQTDGSSRCPTCSNDATHGCPKCPYSFCEDCLHKMPVVGEKEDVITIQCPACQTKINSYFE
jgi:hypothetical protein